MSKRLILKKSHNSRNTFVAVTHLVRSRIIYIVQNIRARIDTLKNKRPHRSFRLTDRRDYKSHHQLPGYFMHTVNTIKHLASNKKTFLFLIAFFSALVIVLTGISNQQTYSQVQELFNESKGDLFTGASGKLGEAGLLLLGAFSGAASNLTMEQQIYTAISLLLVWLSTVWLIREFMAGNRPQMRDGLYNSGAPIVSTALVAFVIVLQLLPVGLVALVYAALSGVGIIDGGFGAMLFAVLALLVGALSLYWATATFIALVIITLPGMYPVRALKAAGDLVVGIRLDILGRLLWLILTVVVGWVVVMIPLVIIDGSIKDAIGWYEFVPLVPVATSVASIATVVWASAYIYLLYRNIVNEGTRRV